MPLPLTPAVFNILLVLAGADAHGYAIMREVERLMGGRARLGPGTLYRSLFKMLGDKWIVELPAPDGRPELDERRRVYRITPLGLAIAREEAQRLEQLVSAARDRGLLGTHRPGHPRTRQRSRA